MVALPTKAAIYDDASKHIVSLSDAVTKVSNRLKSIGSMSQVQKQKINSLKSASPFRILKTLHRQSQTQLNSKAMPGTRETLAVDNFQKDLRKKALRMHQRNLRLKNDQRLSKDKNPQYHNISDSNNNNYPVLMNNDY